MEGIVTMSKQELTRLEVVQRVADGLVSKRRGQPSNHRFDAGFKAQVLDRLRTCYPDFGPTLAAEYLWGNGFPLSRETLRQWMIEDGQWRAAKSRGKPHPPRPRRPRLGELVQIDGSPHDWFEGRGPRYASDTLAVRPDCGRRRQAVAPAPEGYAPPCRDRTLIAFIDDATSQVMAYGCPVALYSDRHSHSWHRHYPGADATGEGASRAAVPDLAGQAGQGHAAGRHQCY